MIGWSRVSPAPFRPLLISVVLAGLTLTFHHVAAAQDTTRALTDEGLRQLAEVVDGARRGGRVWVVMCGNAAPYRILGVYPSLADAQAAVSRQAAGSACVLHGPYVSVPDHPDGVVTYGEVCRKRDDSSCAASDTMMFSIADVESVSVRFALRGGGTWTSRPFRPQEGEAIFFTMAAVDKLLIPYLHRVYGVAYAQRERARLLQSSALRR